GEQSGVPKKKGGVGVSQRRNAPEALRGGLEAQLCSELNLPRIEIPARRAEQRVVNPVMACIAGQREVGPVKQVKAFRTELEDDSLRDVEILEQGHVHVKEVR